MASEILDLLFSSAEHQASPCGALVGLMPCGQFAHVDLQEPDLCSVPAVDLLSSVGLFVCVWRAVYSPRSPTG
jgi:hypothetical protein